METLDLSTSCLICKKKPKITEKKIDFDCGHTCCFSCVPVLFFTLLTSQQRSCSFFQEISKKLPCLLCLNGYSSIPEQEILKFWEKCVGLKRSRDLNGFNQCFQCEENEVLVFCAKCDKFFCEKCKNEVHERREFKNHKMLYDEKNKKSENIANMLQILKEFGRNSQIELEKKLEIETKKIVGICDEILIWASKIKDLVVQKSFEGLKDIKNNLLLFEKSFEYLEKELNKNFNWHINKYFQPFEKEDLHFLKYNLDINFEVEKLSQCQKQLENLYGQYSTNSIFPSYDKEINKYENYYKHLANFEKDPFELLSHKPVLLERYTSENEVVSTFFVLKDESFIVWSSGTERRNLLHMYNLSQMKKQNVIEIGSEINLVSCYKNFAKAGESILLCCGEQSGYLTVFEISNSKNNIIFSEVQHFLTNNSNNRVCDAEIFDDRFHELGNQSIYMMVSLVDCLQIYRLSEGKKIEKIKEMANPSDNWIIINCHYNEKLRKTWIFCGFDKLCVRVYDIKLNDWSEMKFDIDYSLSDIEFLSFTNNAGEEDLFVIFSEWKGNILEFRNVGTGAIIRRYIQFDNIESIDQFLVWNNCPKKKQITIMLEKEKTLLLVDFETLEILKKITVQNEPTAIHKVLMKNNDNDQFEEFLVLFEKGLDETERVLLY